MSDILQTLIDDLKAECNFYTNGICQTRGCLVRGGWKDGDPVSYSFSRATCLPKEQVAAIADRTESNRQLREELEGVKAREVRPRVHGNGFIQVDLSQNKRLHIFGDPMIPKQVVETPIHDHTFNFTSQIISGELTNVWLDLADDSNGTHFVYQAVVRDREDTVLQNTMRRVRLIERERRTFRAGETYSMSAGDFHETLTSGRTVTIITKDKPSLSQGGASPRVLCKVGEKPDNNFNRYAESEANLWDIITASSLITSRETALAAAKEALQRIATQFPIDDGEEVKSLARHKCEQARDALARIAECEKD